jgi:tetratricopeptide (TPR) repeat protein
MPAQQGELMKDATPADLALETARTICTEGIALSAQELFEDAIAKYDAVIAQFSLRRRVGFAQVLTTAMYNKGTALSKLERNEEAVAAYSKLIERYSDIDASVPALIVSQAMRNKAYRLNVLGRSDESIATYEAMIVQFGTNTDPEIEAAVNPVKAFLAERQAVLDASEQSTRT